MTTTWTEKMTKQSQDMLSFIAEVMKTTEDTLVRTSTMGANGNVYRDKRTNRLIVVQPLDVFLKRFDTTEEELNHIDNQGGWFFETNVSGAEISKVYTSATTVGFNEDFVGYIYVDASVNEGIHAAIYSSATKGLDTVKQEPIMVRELQDVWKHKYVDKEDLCCAITGEPITKRWFDDDDDVITYTMGRKGKCLTVLTMNGLETIKGMLDDLRVSPEWTIEDVYSETGESLDVYRFGRDFIHEQEMSGETSESFYCSALGHHFTPGELLTTVKTNTDALEDKDSIYLSEKAILLMLDKMGVDITPDDPSKVKKSKDDEETYQCVITGKEIVEQPDDMEKTAFIFECDDEMVGITFEGVRAAKEQLDLYKSTRYDTEPQSSHPMYGFRVRITGVGIKCDISGRNVEENEAYIAASAHDSVIAFISEYAINIMHTFVNMSHYEREQHSVSSFIDFDDLADELEPKTKKENPTMKDVLGDIADTLIEGFPVMTNPCDYSDLDTGRLVLIIPGVEGIIPQDTIESIVITETRTITVNLRK